MSVFNVPKQIVMKFVGTISPDFADDIRTLAHQPQENEALRQRLDKLEGDVRELRGTVDTLNRDLDDSRRLNLRAAELMDIAFNELAK
ncbi:hypothetical protein [Specibacter sp. NPDC078709]|uniref:hypothetical protein n=1 Tax=Specibacter sp. NPDC078709 TaxID=3154364 RepID=UPI00343955BC